jgi:hypothetical protein
MALSMLGYRCCSDLQDLPETEFECLLAGRPDRVFNAYVNIGSLYSKIRKLAERYPSAKFFITMGEELSADTVKLDLMEEVNSQHIAVLPAKCVNKWKVVCEHLRCPPPICAFPEIEDVGQRRLLDGGIQLTSADVNENAKRDSSPWVIEVRQGWKGIHSTAANRSSLIVGTKVSFCCQLGKGLETKRWLLRDDTFPGNLALFRSSNVELFDDIGAVITVKKAALGVRDYSAGSISSCDHFLFGRFEAELQATDVPGIVTGFFLHRDSPRQEIDIEIVGKRSDCLLVNVFYNPGCEGASFDYGYRGSPSVIELGFDASKRVHRYVIEWNPNQIRWLVDGEIVHERVNWNPTPIPHLAMGLHVNTWPSRSRELAGRIADRRLPATAVVKSISVEANLGNS